MTTETATDYRQELLERAETALERRHTRQAEKIAEQLVREDPSDPRGIALLARAVAARGQLQRAIRLLKQAGADRDAGLSLVMARLLAAAGRLADARQAYISGLRQRPQETSAWLELAAILKQQGDMNGAAEAYANSIRSDPLRQDGYLNLGELMQRARSWDRAIAVYREGLKVIPRSPELMCDLGAALLSSGRVDDAVEFLSRSLTLKPVNDAALYNLGSALLERGDFEAAERRFEQLLKLRPQLGDAWFKFIHCRRQDEESRVHLDKLKKLTRNRSLSDDEKARIWFSLGKLLDDLGDYDEAFEAFREGNEIRKEQHAHDPAANARLTDELITVYRPDLYRRLAPGSDRGRGLVFIVGLPRSGSTLLEQVLGAHSQVACLGENDRLAMAKNQLLGGIPAATVGYPQAINLLDPARIDAMAQKYLRELPVRAPSITDKTLSNYNNVGLIKLLFPAARIVHIRRDPRDTALSMYFADFSRGHGYSFDLDHIRAQIDDYERLMRHWRSLCPREFHELRYEDLVEDFDSTVSGLLRFLGLKPEPALRQFHERRNAVSTASAWQVRQPLYRDSLQRWKRYEAHLGALDGLY